MQQFIKSLIYVYMKMIFEYTRLPEYKPYGASGGNGSSSGRPPKPGKPGKPGRPGDGSSCPKNML